MSWQLNAGTVVEKNAVSSDSVFLVLLKIVLPSAGQPIYAVRNTENITWRGIDWIAFPFEVDEMQESSDGDATQINLKVSNVDRTMERYILEYDTWLKQNPMSPIVVTFYIINSLNLANPTPEIEYEFDINSYSLNAEFATFNLTADNMFTSAFPPRRMLPNTCTFKFKSSECGYIGVETTCNKTLSDCRTRNNSTRFGGFPSIARTFSKIQV